MRARRSGLRTARKLLSLPVGSCCGLTWRARRAAWSAACHGGWLGWFVGLVGRHPVLNRRGNLPGPREWRRTCRPATHVNRSLGELKHLTPHFLPDGRRFLFFAVNQRDQDSAVYEASLDSPQLQRILANPVGPVYLIGSYRLFAKQDSALILQPFDWKTGRLHGAATALDERVYAFAGSYNPLANFTATADILVYQPEGPPQTEMVWFDRQGNRLSALGKVAAYTGPALSPDQKRVAVSIADPKTNFRDLWLIDSRGGMLQLNRRS